MASSYPDAKEFLKNRAALGAAILGAGMALGACADKGRTGGVPIRTGGVVAVPDDAKPPQENDSMKRGATNEGNPVGEHGSSRGKPENDDPPRLPGKTKIEPPPLPGTPPVVPSNPGN